MPSLDVSYSNPEGCLRRYLFHFIIPVTAFFTYWGVAISAADDGLDAASRKEHDPRPDVSQIHSAVLHVALAKPADLISFIIDPHTSYADRIGAAAQGASSVPIEQMPQVLKARDELEAERRRHNWGMLNSPFDARGLGGEDLPPNSTIKTMKILGDDWTVPNHWLPYPLTWDEECQAPWPWQAQQALNDLFIWMPARCDGEKWMEVAMRMPCSNDSEAVQFVEATSAMYFKTVPVMARWYQIVSDPTMPIARHRIAMGLGQTVRLWNDDKAQDMAQVVSLAVMDRGDSNDLEQTTWGLAKMREQYVGPKTLRRPVPATCVLRVCEAAVNPKRDKWTRLYTDAFAVCETVDNPPFAIDTSMDPKSPEVEKYLAAFAKWFEKSRPDLEKAAAEQKPRLDEWRRKFSPGTKGN